MKKLFSLLLMIITLMGYSQNQIAVTATIAGVSTPKKLSTGSIKYVTQRNSVTYVAIQNPTIVPSMIEYAVTDNPDSVVNRANKYGAHFIKVLKSTASSNDYFAFNTEDLVNMASYGNASYPTATSALWFKWPSGIKMVPVVETVAQVVARTDSTIQAQSYNDFTTVQNLTATADTMLYGNSIIVCKNSAATTLKLYNPLHYTYKPPVTIVNKGSASGAVTLTGGYTVKNMGDSTLSTVPIGTSVILKAIRTSDTTLIWQQIK
jgi:hypothetical protein